MALGLIKNGGYTRFSSYVEPNARDGAASLKIRINLGAKNEEYIVSPKLCTL